METYSSYSSFFILILKSYKEPLLDFRLWLIDIASASAGDALLLITLFKHHSMISLSHISSM